MMGDKPNRLEKILLGMLLTITFLLGIKQMIPFTSFDEMEILNWIKNLEQNPFPALKYPPLFLYIHYVLSFIYGKLLTLMGIVNIDSGFIVDSFGFKFTLEAGRIINALTGTLLVYTVYKIGKDFYNKHAAFAAALLMGSNSLVIMYCHIFKPDILITLLYAVTLYFLLHYLRRPRPLLMLYTAFFFGLSTAAKFNAFPIFFLLLAVILFYRKRGTAVTTDFIRSLLFLPMGTAVGFFLGAPNWLIHPILNIKCFINQYTLGAGKLYAQVVPKSAWEVYLEFFQDIALYFSPILLVVFAVAVVTVFVLKSERDIFMTVFLFTYILILAFFGYFADRFSMPVFPIVALLVTRMIFVDLKTLAEKFKKRTAWKYTVIILWMTLLVFVGVRYQGIVKDYNLLKTESEWDRTIAYRAEHNIVDSSFNVARQRFTPRLTRDDILVTKQFIIKRPKLHKHKTLHFVQAHLPTYNSYINGTSNDISALALNLGNYRPFYKIFKRSYQPWNPECVFLYLVPPDLRGIAPGNTTIDLPRPFYRDADTTFLPLQKYEKNPNFGKIEAGKYTHWFYSFKEIKAFKLTVFAEAGVFDFSIRINNTVTSYTLKNVRGLEMVEIRDIEAKMFYHHWVYRVDMWANTLNGRNNVFYLVWEPVYASAQGWEEGRQNKRSGGINGTDGPTGKRFLKEPATAPIPPLFAGQSYPPWMTAFYRETGIDLSLMAFLCRHRLYKNTGNDLGDRVLDAAALAQGVYRLDVVARKLVECFDFGSGAYLEYKIYSPSGVETQRVDLAGTLAVSHRLVITAPVAFVKIAVRDLRDNNYILDSVTVTPDYLDYVNRLIRHNQK